MSDQLDDLRSFVENALSDEDVEFDDIQHIVLKPPSGADRKVIDAFWNELMIFVNDYDIRMKDEQYNANRKARLRDAFGALTKARVL